MIFGLEISFQWWFTIRERMIVRVPTLKTMKIYIFYKAQKKSSRAGEYSNQRIFWESFWILKCLSLYVNYFDLLDCVQGQGLNWVIDWSALFEIHEFIILTENLLHEQSGSLANEMNSKKSRFNPQENGWVIGFKFNLNEEMVISTEKILSSLISHFKR